MTKTTKTSLLGFFTVLLIAVLCLVLGSTPPLQASAARKTQYISEIKFADEGNTQASETWLKNKGYTVLESGLGSNDYGTVGVKYTTNPDEALTDIKVMNMKGGYSFAEYESFLEREKAVSEELVNSLSGGIKELQSRKETPGGQVARKMLNYFYEDDSTKLLGDLLIDGIDVNKESDKQILTKIFMQGNGAANSVIKEAIAIGCLDEGGKNWMEKASEFSAEKGGDLSSVKGGTDAETHGVKAQKILETIQLLSKDLKFYKTWNVDFKEQFKDFGTPGKDESGKDVIIISDAESKLMDEYVNESFKNNQIGYVKLSSIYTILENTTYKDKEHDEINNLADLVIYSNELKTSDLIPVAQFFTDVQANVIYVAGIQRFIQNANNTQKHWDDVMKQLDKAELDDLKVTSVYVGVDRTMFAADGVAMTSDAIRQNLLTPDSNPFLGNINGSLEIAMLAAMAVTGVLAIGAMVWSFAKGWGSTYLKAGSTYWNILNARSVTFSYLPNANAFAASPDELALLKKQYPSSFGTKLTLSTKIFMGAMAVLLIVSIVFLTIELINYYDQEMTRMPSAIVDNQYKDGKNSYVKYDALTMQTGKAYDYNNSKGNQWQIIYATKDKSVGTPITEIRFDTSNTAYQSSHKAVALFGESAARDLKKYGPISVATKYEYMFFKQDPKAYPATGSVFNVGNFILTLSGGIFGGAALGILATYFVLKRKKKKVAPMTQTTTEK